MARTKGKPITVETHPAGADDTFDVPPANVAGISGQALRAFIERIERVQEEVRGLQMDVREIKSEAKGTGFDVKVINYLIKIRKADKDDLDEFESLVDVYKRAIGMAP